MEDLQRGEYYGHLDDMTWACGITFIEITSQVNEWRKIRDLRCDTKIIFIKVMKEQSIRRIKDKDPGRKDLRNRIQWMLWHK